MVTRSCLILFAPTFSEAYTGNSYANADSDYDCARGYSNWRNGWSEGKKHWCCHNRGLGCADVSYPRTYPGSFPQEYRDVHTDYARVQLDDHYDCTAGYRNWKVGWAASKKDYCCHHRGLACPQVNYPETYPGQFPPAYQEVYPDEYQNHKQYGGFGDESYVRYDEPHDDRQHREFYGSRVHLPYDCAAGYSNWHVGWSVRKKEYCCQQGGLGCPDVSYPNSYPGNFPQVYQDAHPDEYQRHVRQFRRYVHHDCAAGYSSWQDGWSVEKKDHCCRDQGLGCPGVAYPNMYPGRFPRVYQTAYPDDYRRHVAARPRDEYTRSVTHVYHHQDDPYDCRADVRAWRENWAVAKKAWCCDRYRYGCTRSSFTSGRRYYNNAADIGETGVIGNARVSDGWRRAIFIGAGCALLALAAFAVRARHARSSVQNGEDLLAEEEML